MGPKKDHRRLTEMLDIVFSQEKSIDASLTIGMRVWLERRACQEVVLRGLRPDLDRVPIAM